MAPNNMNTPFNLRLQTAVFVQDKELPLNSNVKQPCSITLKSSELCRRDWFTGITPDQNRA